MERYAEPFDPPPANGTVVLETGGYRVLIAEDNPDLRRYLEEILADDYETEAVEDGEAALTAVWREPPDVIVSDVVMPRLDGFALARALRAEPDFAGIPLIFLTARAGDADRIAGLAIGADQYLCKPFRSEVLKAHIAAALRTCCACATSSPARRRKPNPAASPRPSAAPEPLPPHRDCDPDRFGDIMLSWLSHGADLGSAARGRRESQAPAACSPPRSQHRRGGS